MAYDVLHAALSGSADTLSLSPQSLKQLQPHRSTAPGPQKAHSCTEVSALIVSITCGTLPCSRDLPANVASSSGICLNITFSLGPIPSP